MLRDIEKDENTDTETKTERHGSREIEVPTDKK
jgi:hypothetical protein